MRSVNFSYDPRLDQLRGSAALLVFLYHAFHVFYGHWHAFPGAFWAGWLVEGHTGVGLFFVLSGFLFMNIALAAPDIEWVPFMRNRLLRIFPLFVVMYVVATSVGRDAFRPADLFYLLFSNLGEAPTSNSFITGAAWSISIEFTFYMVFPYLARFAIQYGAGWLIRLIALWVLLRCGAYFVTEQATHMYYSTLLGRFDQFLIGMLCAMFVKRMPVLHERRLSILWPLAATCAVVLILGLLGSKASYQLPVPKQPVWAVWGTLEALMWGGFVICYSCWRGSLPKPAASLFSSIGEVSYSFYLLHGVVLFIFAHFTLPYFEKLNWRVGMMLVMVTLLPLCLFVARLSYQVIERPWLQMRGRYHGKLQPASVAASASSVSSVSQ
ncbi:acyltransferase family protein [Paraburkholderia unamae]|uniref:Peptidoglycan/LPS O-acetylase OafA/YrhL n=1 Tax=Paraburkholderia unamae TaxID=219649 RepID=A0ABX5KJY6_9BURK|nr:acyltransferase [Paraburkholderia unamae]PVX82176.1 peptidoglycan/LPS O-acetylase OafA/YrhL [Paraburkholderia unamae]